MRPDGRTEELRGQSVWIYCSIAAPRSYAPDCVVDERRHRQREREKEKKREREIWKSRINHRQTHTDYQKAN